MFNEQRVTTLRVFAALIALSALAASMAGIIDPSMYKPIASDQSTPFTYGQDLVSAAAAVVLLTTIRRRDFRSNLLQIGIVAYLFYAYAPYVMGTMYNHFYLVYMAIFGLSIFYFINAFIGIDYEKMEIEMPESLRIATAICCIGIVVYFAPQWVFAILSDVKTNTWPSASGFRVIYYVYILDLSFVLPVCAAASVFLLQQRALGYVLGGVIPILGFALMLSVTLGFVCQPLFEQNMSVADAIQFAIITFVFLFLVIWRIVSVRARPAPSLRWSS